eukprot:jgi/Astpho2/3038/fgenesh1_pg.00051_%23_48_t
MDATSSSGAQGSHDDLLRNLQGIDGRPYGAYKSLCGAWAFPGFQLLIHHVQTDPFAPPSRCSVRVPAAVANYPCEVMRPQIRQTALCDFLTRRFKRLVREAGADVRQQSGGWGGAKGGEVSMDGPGQHVLERTSILFSDQGDLEARFTMALPGRGRSIMGEWAATVLVQDLPRYVEQGLLYSSQHHAALQRHVLSVEDQESLRSQISGLRLAAFVADGSILPRTSGASDGPMPSPPAVAFQSPSSLAMEVQLPNRGIVKGMGIPVGVPGDGRELVATDASAVKIRAEDGRMVQAVDISPFIRNLPFGRDTTNFSTEDASGSTSQAANIQEALEAGSQLLLLDEDTCATNFMIRDARMQCTEQLAENSQTRAIGDALFLFQGMLGRSAGLSDLLDQLEAAMNLKVMVTGTGPAVKSAVLLALDRGATVQTECPQLQRDPEVQQSIEFLRLQPADEHITAGEMLDTDMLAAVAKPRWPTIAASFWGADYEAAAVPAPSHQLALAGATAPQAAAVLNCTPEQLDLHGSLARQAAAMCKVFSRMGPSQVAAIPAGHGDISTLDLSCLPAAGAHNTANAATAALLAASLGVGVSPASLQRTIPLLKAPPHRLQSLGQREGVHFVDDSASCTVESTIAGLQSLHQPTVLLIGGESTAEQDGSLGFAQLGKFVEGHRWAAGQWS